MRINEGGEVYICVARQEAEAEAEAANVGGEDEGETYLVEK